MTTSSVVGHKTVSDFLFTSLKHNRLHHAYLLLGPRGIGKSLLVKRFMAYLFCQSGTACGQCPGCEQLDHSSHPDVWWLQRAADKQDIAIDQVRELQEFINLNSLTGGWRVVVIDGAHYLNAESGNALLKSLEEPAAKVLFFLLSDEPKRLLPTIRSRCFVLQLGSVATAEIEQLARAQGASARQAQELARLAGGRPGVAVRLWQEPESWQRELNDARLFLELSAGNGFTDFVKYLEGEIKESALDQREPRRRALELVASWRRAARDLICYKLDLPQFAQHISLEVTLQQGASRPIFEILQLNHLVEQAQAALMAGAHIRLTLEWVAYAVGIKQSTATRAS